MRTMCSLGVVSNHLGMAICLVSQRVDADRALYHVHAYRSTERTSPDTLKIWITEALQEYSETSDQPPTHTVAVYHESLQKAKSWTRQAGQRFGKSLICWQEREPIADRQTVTGDVKGVFNEGRVSVDSSQILTDLDRELNQCTRDESGKWVMTLGAEAIVLSLGEMEHRHQCGLNRSSGRVFVGGKMDIPKALTLNRKAMSEFLNRYDYPRYPRSSRY